ncbi:MAG: hypothetical protein HQ568_11245 [Calditrichaeota bacterium]|nr:hypothetical protein [Calditrichota bacterium]
MLRSSRIFIFFFVILFIGCAAPKTKKIAIKSQTAPEAVYCNDATGHLKNAKPWISGGTCCCTPTEEMFNIYKKEGTVDKSMQYAAFLELFKNKGIVTDLDPGYKGSNNRDDHGPHVILGGKSMVTPTSGTDNYEEAVSGIRKVKVEPKK